MYKPNQQAVMEAYRGWVDTGTLKADKNTLRCLIERMTEIANNSIGFKEYSLVFKDAVENSTKLKHIYKARYGEEWKPREEVSKINQEMMEQQADAWITVTRLLDDIDPKWLDRASTGLDSALTSITRLAYRKKEL